MMTMMVMMMARVCGPKGNSEFCFPKTLNVSRAKTKGNIEVKEIVCFTLAGSEVCCGFKEHDLITCESKVHVIVSLGI